MIVMFFEIRNIKCECDNIVFINKKKEFLLIVNAIEFIVS